MQSGFNPVIVKSEPTPDLGVNQENRKIKETCFDDLQCSDNFHPTLVDNTTQLGKWALARRPAHLFGL